MTTEWEKHPFTECVQPIRVDRGKQVKAREYLSSGKYPVVDQGQGSVAGWTDSEAVVIRDGLPYVVFGDHTRLLKYVDFPFALGADGTKLIKPKDNINPLYFYFHLLCLDIPSRGYSRHYRLLKEREISLPPLPEQKKIAAVLLKIQRAIETQEKIIQSVRDLKKSTMQHLFTHGLRGEKTKMTKIGEIPESWEVRPLGEITDITAGGTPSRSNHAYWQNGTIPWVKTGEIDYRVITATEEHITKLGLENSSARLFARGTLLLAMYGQGITRGKVAILGVEAATNQATAAIIPKGSSVKTPFIYHYFTWSYDSLRSHGHGAQQANLNAKIVADFPIAVPFQEEQEDIATVIDTVDSKTLAHEFKKSAFQDLFKTTLNKLMTGGIRITDLNIDTSEVEG